MNLDAVHHFMMALFIGALIGIEREQGRGSEPGRRFGGVRTYILVALVGAVSAWLARELASAWILAATLVTVSAAGVAHQLGWRTAGVGRSPGLTSEIASVAVFLLAAMVMLGGATLAVALSVVVCAILALKHPLHGFIARIRTDELLAGIKLLSATLIVLPLLPREAIDPWQAINPYQLWLLVILTSALSLVGYVAVRWMGADRGAAVTGIAGGMVSSTATTLCFARDSGRAGASADGRRETTGILLSWLVMFARVTVLTAVVNLSLLRVAWMPLCAMALATAILSLASYQRRGTDSGGHTQTLPVRNPFSLAEAIRFALLFAVILLVIGIAREKLPSIGVYGVAALAGLADVDAIALSLSQAAGASVPSTTAAQALCLAVLANTATKTATVLLIGKGALRWRIGIASLSIATAGGISAWLAF
jgi:uncharacterized membrane protein (DUF4010 family)